MSWYVDHSILKRAVDEGLVNLETLLEKGILDQATVERLMQLVSEKSGPDSPVEQLKSYSSVKAKQIESAKAFGRYEDLQLIGEGGMAKVHKAFDPTLQRPVALKFLRTDDAEMKERFIREGRSQARIEHRNVCKVFEAGEVDGTPYIAMQLISGKTLKEMRTDLRLEESVKLIRDVAMAVHEAHRMGIIHRDIKPANIIVERSEEGELVPYVMDFGLARDLQPSEMSATGLVVGSPSYMSPEQAKGENRTLDRRTDIYSLGATFYELLCGTPPFASDSNAQTLLRVLEEEPPLPRQKNPTIPADLETIILKCLDKERDRRYESARALGEDLQHYLDGEPILARPYGIARRLWKKARKHKTVLALISLSVIIAITWGGTALQARASARKRAALTQKFAEEINKIETTLRYHHLLPLHDVSPEIQTVRGRLEQINGMMKQLGEDSFGPGNYALGRGYMALRDYETAQLHLRKASDEYEYKTAEAFSALGLTLASLYQKELESADRITTKAVREKRIAEIQKQFRDPALNFIRQGSSSLETPEYVKALIAFLEKKYPETVKRSESAASRTPWLYEAFRLQANAYFQMASDQVLKGNYKEALILFRKSEKAYQESIRRGPSDARGYEDLCGLYVKLLHAESHDLGLPVEESFQKGMQACENALVSNPKSVSAYFKKATLAFRLGEIQSVNGQDPKATLKTSIEAGNAALKLEPKNAYAHNALANAYIQQAEYDLPHGQDPMPNLNNAIRHYQSATSLNPRYGDAFYNLGLAFWTVAQHQATRGQDPRDSLREATRGFVEADRIDKDDRMTLTSLGAVYLTNAEYEATTGYDPVPNIESAIKAFQRVTEINKNYPYAYGYLGVAHQVKASNELAIGKNPHASGEAGIVEIEKALKINQALEFCYLNKAAIAAVRAEYDLRQNRDPSQYLSNVKAILNERQYASPDAPRILGQAELLSARWKILEGGTPGDSFQKAHSAATRALKINPESAETYQVLSDIYRYESEWQLKRNLNPEPFIKKGFEAADRSLTIKKDLAEARAIKGVLFLIRSQSKISRDDALDAARSSLELLNQALKMNRNLTNEYESYLAQANRILNNR